MGKAAQHLAVPVDEPTRQRLGAFVLRIGIRKAAVRLRVGQETIDSARRHGGALLPETIERIRGALDREELQAAS